MGWGSGSRLLCEVINIVYNYVENEDIRSYIYEDLIPAFADMDCDTIQECIGIDAIFDFEYKQYCKKNGFDYDLEE